MEEKLLNNAHFERVWKPVFIFIFILWKLVTKNFAPLIKKNVLKIMKMEYKDMRKFKNQEVKWNDRALKWMNDDLQLRNPNPCKCIINVHVQSFIAGWFLIIQVWVYDNDHSY